MSDKFTLNATARSDVGKGASRRLRNANKIPGIVYGASKSPQTIVLDHNEVTHALQNEAFYSHILTLNLNNQPEKVILKDLQRHSYKPRITHMDLQRISKTEKITMDIPLHFIGGNIAPGVKEGGGLVSHLLTEITVRCLPADLPESIEVDISKLELNDTIHLSDLKLAKDVEILDLTHEEDKPVVTIYLPRAAVEAPAAEVAVAAEEAAPAEAEAAPAKTKEKSKKEEK